MLSGEVQARGVAPDLRIFFQAGERCENFPRRIGSWQCFQELLPNLHEWARDMKIRSRVHEVSNYAATAIEIIDEQIEDIYFTLRSKCWAPIKKRELQKQIRSRKNHGSFFPKEMKPICSSHCNHLFCPTFQVIGFACSGYKCEWQCHESL